mmetsp:Transcript_33750/g.79697  ORF Transcript_33750/g.79697 Transcript_33750/m.79697 type:complete len:412 (-) Transcript_33750:109-1344(-)
MVLDHPLARARSLQSAGQKNVPTVEDAVMESMVQGGRIQSHPGEQRNLKNEKVDNWRVQWPPPPSGMPLPRVKPAIAVDTQQEEEQTTTPRSRPFVSASSAGTFKAFESVPVFQVLRASSFRSASSVSMRSFKEIEEDEAEMPAWMKRGSQRSMSSTGSRISRNSGSFSSLPRTPTAGHNEGDVAEDPFLLRPASTPSTGNTGFGYFGAQQASTDDEVSPSNKSVGRSPKSLGGSTKSILKRVMPTESSGTCAAQDPSQEDSEEDLESVIIGTKQLIGHLNKQQQDLLRASLKPVTFSAQQHVVRKGAPGSSMFFVISGAVKVEVEDGPVLGNGFFFGEMVVVKQWLNKLGTSGDDARRSADVVAISDCRLMELDGEAAYKIFKDDSTAWSILLSITATREGSRQVLIPVI